MLVDFTAEAHGFGKPARVQAILSGTKWTRTSEMLGRCPSFEPKIDEKLKDQRSHAA